VFVFSFEILFDCLFCSDMFVVVVSGAVVFAVAVAVVVVVAVAVAVVVAVAAASATVLAVVSTGADVVTVTFSVRTLLVFFPLFLGAVFIFA
jgi:hypothetical protein